MMTFSPLLLSLVRASQRYNKYDILVPYLSWLINELTVFVLCIDSNENVIFFTIINKKYDASRQNQNLCLQTTQSPGHPRDLIRVFTVWPLSSQGFSVSLGGQQIL